MKTQQAAMFALVAIVAGTGGIFSGFSVSSDDAGAYSEEGNVMGHITLTVTDESGNIKDYIQTDNLVVDAGMDTMADLVFPDINTNSNSTDGKFEWIGIGTGTTAAAAANTAEETLISGCNRVTDSDLTSPAATSATGETVVTVDASFSGSSCAGAVTEAVLANSGTGAAAGAGEILARQVFSPVNVGSSDTLTVSWEITLT